MLIVIRNPSYVTFETRNITNSSLTEAKIHNINHSCPGRGYVVRTRHISSTPRRDTALITLAKIAVGDSTLALIWAKKFMANNINTSLHSSTSTASEVRPTKPHKMHAKWRGIDDAKRGR